jgi:hypothetical protein
MTEPEPSQVATPESASREPAGALQVEQFFGMIAQRLEAPDPFLDKLDSRQVGKLLDQAAEDSRREHERAMFSLKLTAGMGIAAFALIFGLCWLFLAYQKSDQIEKIIALLIGLVGGLASGIGIGRWSKE